MMLAMLADQLHFPSFKAFCKCKQFTYNVFNDSFYTGRFNEYLKGHYKYTLKIKPLADNFFFSWFLVELGVSSATNVLFYS